MFYDNDKSFRFVLITDWHLILTTVHASLCSVRQRGQAAVQWGRSLANRFSSYILNDLIQVDRFEQSHLLLAGNRMQVRVIVKCLRAVPPSFWGSVDFSSYSTPFKRIMASPDSRLEKTTNSRSPYIQEINEDIRQSHRIYHFQNCGTVCMSAESFNARGVRMENCGNNIPQVTCSYSLLSFFPFRHNVF